MVYADSESKQLMGGSDERRAQVESVAIFNGHLYPPGSDHGSLGQKKKGRELRDGRVLIPSVVLTNASELEKLYSGKYSDVFRVKRKDGNQFVIKRLKKSDVPAPRHLHKEVLALCCLDRHANIIHFIDWGSDRQYLYISLEFIPGGTLKDFVNRWEANKLPLNLWTFLMKQLAGGLNHIHKEGFAHRDIKPANLLMKGQLPEHLLCESRPNSFASNRGGSFQLKIADFGFSTHKEQSRTICGSPLFMPPEIDEVRVLLGFVSNCHIYIANASFPSDEEIPSDEGT